MSYKAWIANKTGHPALKYQQFFSQYDSDYKLISDTKFFPIYKYLLFPVENLSIPIPRRILWAYGGLVPVFLVLLMCLICGLLVLWSIIGNDQRVSMVSPIWVCFPTTAVPVLSVLFLHYFPLCSLCSVSRFLVNLISFMHGGGSYWKWASDSSNGPVSLLEFLVPFG